MPRPKSKALGHLYDRFIAGDPEQVASYERARANSEVAESVHRLRTEAGLSQRELASRVGTSASVICRLEDADYEGHSLSMLRRIAAAVGRRVEISFPPMTPTGRADLEAMDPIMGKSVPETEPQSGATKGQDPSVARKSRRM